MTTPSDGLDDTATAPGTTAVASATPDTVLADPVLSERYRVLEMIAPGTEDALYLARRLDTGAQVELRVLTSSLGGDRVLVAALVQHVTPVARVAGECPGIAAFYGCERTGGGLVLAMEHPGGPTLREVIKREGTLSLNRVLRLAVGLARVLEQVHTLGLVHGGLRPENVVLTGIRRPRHALNRHARRATPAMIPAPSSTGCSTRAPARSADRQTAGCGAC